MDLAFDRRVAPRIENFAAEDFSYDWHLLRARFEVRFLPGCALGN